MDQSDIAFSPTRTFHTVKAGFCKFGKLKYYSSLDVELTDYVAILTIRGRRNRPFGQVFLNHEIIDPFGYYCAEKARYCRLISLVGKAIHENCISRLNYEARAIAIDGVSLEHHTGGVILNFMQRYRRGYNPYILLPTELLNPVTMYLHTGKTFMENKRYEINKNNKLC